MKTQRRRSEIGSIESISLFGPIDQKKSKSAEEEAEDENASKERFTTERSHSHQQIGLFSNQRLRTLPFFKHRNQEFVSELLDNAILEVFHAGECILHEGDSGDSMYILSRGDVEVIHNNVVVCHLSDGTIFGEIALLGVSSRRTATVRALKFCDCRVLHREQFLKILTKYPDEHAYYEAAAQRRLGELKNMEKVKAGDGAKKGPDRQKMLADAMAKKLRAKPSSSGILPRKKPENFASRGSLLPGISPALGRDSTLGPEQMRSSLAMPQMSARSASSRPYAEASDTFLELPPTASSRAAQSPSTLVPPRPPEVRRRTKE